MSEKPWQRGVEPWFARHGLPYFVEAERERARAALRPRRAVPWLVLVVLVAAGAAVGLTWLTGRGSTAPASVTAVALAAALAYGVTALRARPIVAWALRRTVGSGRDLVPMVTRALPLLLLFVTFLFVNGEVWQLAAHLDGAVLWLAVLLFASMALLFLAVRLPDEVDAVGDHVGLSLLVRATRGTPLAEPTGTLVDQYGDDLHPERLANLSGWERRNLILVLLVTQVAQVLLLSLAVFAFFILFGGLVMSHEVQVAWVGEESQVHALPYLDNLSVELVQVSVFLAAFSGLYFTVGVLTDETYREQFFSTVLAELERAVGVRTAYLALREHPLGEQRPSPLPEDQPAATWTALRAPLPGADDPPVAAVVENEVVAHWGFTQQRADDISDGVVSGELAHRRDGSLLRRYGGASYRHGRTRWDFGPWHPFTGWRSQPDEGAARMELERRGYQLHRPGPLSVEERTGGPFGGPPEPPEPLD